MHRPDEELVARWKGGDGKALDERCGRHLASIHKFNYARVQDWPLAWDLTQDTFVNLIRARDKIDPSRPFAPYLFRIARNTRLSWLRAEGRWHRVFVPLGRHEALAGPNDVDNVLAVEQAVSELPTRLRIVHELRMQGFSNAEVAFILDLSVRTIVTANKEIEGLLRDTLTRPLVETKPAVPPALPKPKKVI